MIKAFLVLSLMMSCSFAQINWASSYNAALASAKTEHKNVMVMLSKEGCPACDYMESVVFEDSAVEKIVNSRFIPVHIDVHEDEVPAGLGFIGTPTFYFLSPSGKTLKRIDGGAKIPKFIQILNSVQK